MTRSRILALCLTSFVAVFGVHVHAGGFAPLSVGLGPPRAEAQIDVDTRRCINTANRSLRTVLKAIQNDARSCIQDGAKGKLDDPDTIEVCVDADRKEKVAKAKQRSSDNLADDCAEASTDVLLDLFGVSTGEVGPRVGDAATEKERRVLDAMFGDSLDAAVVSKDADRDAAKCQDNVLQKVFVCQNVRLSEFARCTKKALKSGVLPTPADLSDTCLGTSGPSQPDEREKIAKACRPNLAAEKPSQLAKTVNKTCVDPGVVLSDAFPGCRTDDPEELARCLDTLVACEVCETLRDVAAMTRSCDEFDDGVHNGSCPTACGGPPYCDDGNACTHDSCDDVTGQCVHELVVCNDGNACTVDVCLPAFGCDFVAVDCDDGDSCTVDSCNPTTGQCQSHSTPCPPGFSFDCAVGVCVMI